MNSSNLPNILVVDDDAGLRDLLAGYLASQGYQVAAVGDAPGMDAWLAVHQPDLIVLDLVLPGEDGLAITRRLKASRPALPIIMLSARGDDVDRIIGLEVGADDYLPKPFNPRELLARIRAALRRGAAVAPVNAPAPAPGFRFGPFLVAVEARRLTRDGVEIPLTGSEFDLLQVFIEHPNRVLSRDQIMDLLKGYERDPFDRSIDTRVTRLRRKLEDSPQEPVYIRTVWGKGYLFAPGGKGE